MVSDKYFSEISAERDPFIQFDKWFHERLSSGIKYPESFSLATSDTDGSVSARIVLLKEYSGTGFVFYTNYESRKGMQISSNPNAAMLFYWPESSRQVRIEGKVTRVPEEESEKYFSSRPRESRIGAWASNQDKIIPGRAYLDKRYAEFKTKFIGKKVPRPHYWGGYRIIPSWFEFWQEGDHRLHDRIIYLPEGKSWKIARLSP